MSKLTIIKIDRGDFDSGFDATVRIEENGGCIYDQTHRLPPASHLPELYQSWKSGYSDRHLRGDNDGENTPLREKSSFRVIKIVEGQTTNLSIGELANDLERGLNEWLNSLERGVQEFREGLLENLSKTEEIRFVIETGDEILERLPWERWDFFDRYDNGDVVLNFPNRVTPRPGIQLKEKVKILVILGESSDIDVQADLHLLQDRLPSDAEILEPLIATSREKVDRALWDKKFDILFFAGHSSTDFGNGRGKFYINDTESLTVADLKEGLKRAIANGLKLAIFNSCDGIGLGRDLTDLQMPAIVVMREKIPDEAAQRFLEFFLKAFALEGKTLSAAVTEAKKRLIGIEGRYPCASWLPVLCQHPEAEMLTWESLREVKQKRRLKLPELRSLPKVVGGSLLIAAAVMGVSYQGFLQSWEWKAYDRLMRQRPTVGPDNKLLIIKYTEKDIQEYGGYPMTDETMARLLERLKEYRPRVIGSTMYRDREVGEGRENLETIFNGSELPIINICKLSGSNVTGIPGVPNVSVENRLGFSDVTKDEDEIVRRLLLSSPVSAKSPCRAPHSFNLLVALHYLEKEGIVYEGLQGENWKIGDVIFKKLQSHTGPYRGVDDAGYQIPLNYRPVRSHDRIAESVSVGDILGEDGIKPEAIESLQDRIILIGVDAPNSVPNTWNTPYSAGAPLGKREIPAVVLQAHKVSFLVNIALGEQRQLSSWSLWLEILWVGGWSLVGGSIAWGWRSLKLYGLALAIAASVLYCLCLVFLIFDLWVPLVPPALVLILTSSMRKTVHGKPKS